MWGFAYEVASLLIQQFPIPCADGKFALSNEAGAAGIRRVEV